MRQQLISTTFLICIMLLLLGVSGLSLADEKKKIVLQISDASQEKQTLVLNVADNLLEVYGKKLELEIVAFGPGLRLLLGENANQGRIEKLAEKGVRFSACRNTYRKMNKLSKKKIELSSKASEVSGGAARIIDLVEQGYILVRP